MDPTKCFEDILQAIKDNDNDLAYELAQDLQSWIDNGGFWPVGYSQDEVEDQLIEIIF